MIQVLLLTLVFCALSTEGFGTIEKNKRDTESQQIPLQIEELIRGPGYPVESHEIKTDDGYLLTYHRIPHGKGKYDGSPGAPVILQHGLMSSSADWLMTDQSFGFCLADAGFDVWLGNARGNTCSRKHVQLDPDKDKEKFWDFSFHEMGTYDLPAAIDYILQNTSNDQLIYIGYSMGTTMFFVLGSMRPEYMRKVNAMVALAPVTRLQDIRSPMLKSIINTQGMIMWATSTFGIHALFEEPYHSSVKHDFICSNPYLQFICEFLLSEVCGFNSKEFNKEKFPKILDYFPAGVSVKTLKHFSQVVDNGFKLYDYHPKINMKKYGNSKPPDYNMSLVTSPVYIWWGENDLITGAESVKAIASQLPDVRRVTKVPDSEFNHMDFMWAVHSKDLLYKDIISTLISLRQG